MIRRWNLAPDCLGGHPPLAHAVAAAGIERIAVAFQAQALDGDRPARPLRPPQPRSAPLGRLSICFKRSSQMDSRSWLF